MCVSRPLGVVTGVWMWAASAAGCTVARSNARVLCCCKVVHLIMSNQKTLRTGIPLFFLLLLNGLTGLASVLPCRWCSANTNQTRHETARIKLAMQLCYYPDAYHSRTHSVHAAHTSWMKGKAESRGRMQRESARNQVRACASILVHTLV